MQEHSENYVGESLSRQLLLFEREVFPLLLLLSRSRTKVLDLSVLVVRPGKCGTALAPVGMGSPLPIQERDTWSASKGHMAGFALAESKRNSELNKINSCIIQLVKLIAR